MTTFTASITPPGVPSFGDGREVTVNARASIAVTGTASSVILFAKIPVGAKLLDYMWFASDMGSGQTYDLGFIGAPSGTTLTQSSLRSALSLSVSNTFVRGTQLVMGYKVSFSDDVAQRWVWLGATMSKDISGSAEHVFQVRYKTHEA